ncbi:MAG: 5'-nucleotidase [Chitinophagales bacterium]
MKTVQILVASLLLILSFGCKPLHVIHTEAEEIKTSEESKQADEINSMIAPYKEQLEGEMEDTLAFLMEDLNLGKPESTLGNHVAEIIYWEAQRNYDQKVDFAISNIGGIRVPSVSKGPLQIKDAYQIMPFDNYVSIMKVPGSIVLELANNMAANGGWPIHLMSYDIQNNKAVNIKIQGEVFDINKEYSIALTDYLANGGDYLSFLKNYAYINTDIYMRDAIISFWKTKSSSNQKIEGVLDGRVKIIQ